MVDALVSFVIEQLAEVIQEEVTQRVRLVVGVEEEVQKLTTTFKAVQAVIKDAEQRKVRDELVRLWLEELTKVANDMKCVLTEWTDELRRIQKLEGDEDPASGLNTKKKSKVSPYFRYLCFCYGSAAKRHDIGSRIKDIRERLDEIAMEKDKYRLLEAKVIDEVHDRVITSSMVDVSDVCGRHDDKEIIVNELVMCSNDVPGGGQLQPPDVISIVGMEGIGKTTLAQLVFNEDKVQDHFELTMWICVSSYFELVRVGKAILEEAGQNIPNTPTWNALQRKLKETFTGKRFLLVFDDVWTADQTKWEPLMLPLKYGAQGSRILVTTRHERVAMMMNSTFTHSLPALSHEHCCVLFSRVSLHGSQAEEHEVLNDIGTKIVEKCHGLPLVVKTVASVLRFKRNLHEWKHILECDIWELEELEHLKGLRPNV